MDDGSWSNDATDSRRGFLPPRDPLCEFDAERHTGDIGEYLRTLNRLGHRLPDLLDTGELRSAVRSLEAPPVGTLDDLNEREFTRLCLLSGFLASGYVNLIGAEPVDVLPRGVAVPLYETSREIGRKPILSYDLLCLHNFRRPDPAGDITLDNLDTVQQFTRHDDERWFVSIHVAIEAAAIPAMTACSTAQRAISRDDPHRLREALETIAASIADQIDIMRRMTDGNDTTVFANAFRPYYNGFEDVVYEGVDETDGQPQTFRGGSGAQSSILPAIDATLGIDHRETAMTEKLDDMRRYMPPKHRSTVDTLRNGPDVVRYVDGSESDELRTAYNTCIDELTRFRDIHFEEVIQYIREETGDETGTGGTDYMSYLREIERETEAMGDVR